MEFRLCRFVYALYRNKNLGVNGRKRVCLLQVDRFSRSDIIMTMPVRFHATKFYKYVKWHFNQTPLKRYRQRLKAERNFHVWSLRTDDVGVKEFKQ